ncbi:hypothetical protein IEQ34_000708 [Dendrobium chrysotoxum]|uniref:DUF7138 domain-containing protein n=1 Tax=Dendrobium chrysotoxum TaxID=161865 RepID=A0AAV7H9S0_DENCH|nr:hypothetical protein IEQ34_000708 [Dendrobium chrysotoxum]
METPKALTSYPVSFHIIFFNGIKEVDVGNILMSPSISFKIFKRLISLKLGIPARQILTYLVRQNNATSSMEIRRKVQINELSDFAVIIKERGCFILAVLKRFPMKCWNVGVPVAIGLRHWNFESRLDFMQRQREMYPMLDACTSLAPKAMKTVTSSELVDAAEKSVVCKECISAQEEGRTMDFHCCVYDEITVGFRTTAGPIQRPSKHQHEDFDLVIVISKLKDIIKQLRASNLTMVAMANEKSGLIYELMQKFTLKNNKVPQIEMETPKALTSYSTSFPVIFFNGIKEVDVGNILISQSISYKIFKRLISLKLGIPARQILTYLVCRNNATSSLGICRKVQINKLSDFAVIVKERGCFILVVLKRFPTKYWNVDVPIAIIRTLELPEPPILQANAKGAYTVTSSKMVDATVKSVVCKECIFANEGRTVDFHCCVYDKITLGFRTTAGPIQRPSK